MTLSIENRQRIADVDRRAVRRLVRIILDDHHRGRADLTIVFCDDAFIQELNASYRDVDRPTDVLAFVMTDETEDLGETDERPEAVLGDVVISVQRAAVQARRYRRTLEREILKLVAHGVLHLLGVDHQTTKERTAMRSLENRYLRAMSGKAP